MSTAVYRSTLLPHAWLVVYYRPIFLITLLKAGGKKGYSLSVGFFCFRRKELHFRLRSWQVNAGAELHEVRFCLSHFLHRRTSSKRIGPLAAPRLFCGDAQCVKLIRSSVTGAAASKRMMSITTGLAFAAVAVPVARGPSPSSRCFLSRTRTTVC